MDLPEAIIRLEARALELAERAYPGRVATAGWYPLPREAKDGDGPCWAATLTDGTRVSGPFKEADD